MKRPVLEINKKYLGINFYLFDTLIVVLLIKAAIGYILNEPRILIDTDEIYI